MAETKSQRPLLISSLWQALVFIFAQAQARSRSVHQVTGASGGPISTGESGETSATPGTARNFSAVGAAPIKQPISSSRPDVKEAVATKLSGVKIPWRKAAAEARSKTQTTHFRPTAAAR